MHKVYVEGNLKTPTTICENATCSKSNRCWNYTKGAESGTGVWQTKAWGVKWQTLFLDQIYKKTFAASVGFQVEFPENGLSEDHPILHTYLGKSASQTCQT